MSHHLRIVRGEPDVTELAALTAVLTALACGAAAESPVRPAPGGPCRAHWDRAWRAHHSSGSWRARTVAVFPFHRR
ncbi:acyl-CoA carboxylase subunit epsilon [Streptomyces sp. LP05-1]|uniref:Acyl-CoA carboxylase subunit epsilon n=1 Tax=Streptomyces pyxinae TaxID=2970734 RepID=A0ABT2CBY3_9ACTN|nr:acyl-CoA carboxylase subunit epsilon [Streptomyces sp. LP05-1]MCS0634918.1 acyl-CoA carboxylase subunit epsilon [Streptomyces sp. LP05-1]